MKNLSILTALMLLLGSATLHADVIFESPLQFRELDAAIGTTSVMTIDGIVEQSARLMPDIDGDGRAEWYFRSTDPLDPECEALTIAMSTNVFGSDFSSSDLNNMLRIRRNRPVNDDGTVTERCQFITAFSVLDDINGDGIGEITTSVTSTVFGNVQPGAIIDDQNLDASEGTVVFLGRHPFSVGDINGDGFNDFAIGIFGVSTRVYAGRADIPVFLDNPSTIGDNLLFESELSSSITPIGDFNGDGFDDLLIQGTFDSTRYSSIIYGESNFNLRITELSQIEQNTVRECEIILCTLGPAGDFDDDGLDDMVVSARERFLSNAESVIVYGAASGFPTSEAISNIPNDRKTLLFSASGSNIFNRVNESRLLNDLNGDGHQEVLINFNSRDVVLFSTPGKRAVAISVDTVDGSDGILIEPTNIGVGDINYFVDDVDDDGLPDLSFSNFYLRGLNFPEPQLPQLDTVLRQSPGNINLFWQTVNNVDSFRIQVDGREISSVSGDTNSLDFDDPTQGEGGILTVEALDPTGSIIATATRRIRPVSENPFNLRVEVYGETLVELFFQGTNNRYLILRDGEVMADRVYGTSYLDNTVEAGQTYQYAIVPDLRTSDDADLITLDLAPSYQRISATITVTTPGSSDPDPESQPLTIPGNLSGVVYSNSALEINWVRSTGANAIRSYSIFRDGEIVGSTEGNSFFDSGLSPGTTYTYSVSATDVTGTTSDQSTPLLLTTNGESGNNNNPIAIPTGFRAEIYSAAAIELFWDRQQIEGIRYNLYQNDELIANTDGTSFFIDNLQTTQSNTFALSAVSAAGEETDRVSIRVGNATMPDSMTPTNVTAAVYGPSLVEIFWDRLPGLVTYNVYIDGVFRFNTEGTSQLIPLDGTATQFDIALSSVNTSGVESSLSDSITVTVDR